MATLKADSCKIKFPGGIVIDAEDLRITNNHNDLLAKRMPKFSINATLDHKNTKGLRNLHDQLVKEHIKIAVERRNEFIEKCVRQYMAIHEIDEDGIKLNGCCYIGKGWEQYNYKKEMIIRIETDLNWRESSVSYRYSVNEVLKTQ